MTRTSAGRACVATDPVDLALREDPQDPGLGLGRHVADLVEEQGAPVGGFELAGPRLDPGGHAPLDTEQLALQQVPRQRRAVEGDQRRGRAVRGSVEVAREQLLAGARLAPDQDAHPAGATRAACS